MSIGDLVLDSSGAVGVVTNVYSGHIQYKTTTHDGMEFVYESSVGMVVPLGEKFKRLYYSEMRKLERRREATHD